MSDVKIKYNGDSGVYISNKTIKWHQRLWRLLTAPFRYVIKGEFKF